MPDLSGQLGSAFDSFMSSSVVQTLMSALIFYLFVVWLAAAFWAFRDMHERSENPVLPYLAAGVIILFTPFLFFLGVVVYRVIRPSERLGEVYERNLAEEALLAEVETVRTCRGCDRRVDPEWIVCPWCRARLNRVCPNCERLVGLDWNLCAWCGKDFERAAGIDHLVRQTPTPPQPRASLETRLATESRPSIEPRVAMESRVPLESRPPMRPAAPMLPRPAELPRQGDPNRPATGQVDPNRFNPPTRAGE